jgi:chaperone required for assembly of F1-ATPase
VKRFYKFVTTEKDLGGYSIRLDGKPVKTPSGKILSVPMQKLAEAIVLEWAAQETNIVPDSMPLTQILTTAIDRIANHRADMERSALAYLDTDLLCYRTNAPEELARRQHDVWQPWLDGFEAKHGVRLDTTTGLMALKQPVAAHEKVASIVRELDDFRFAAFQLAVSLTGSLVLALALADGSATAEQIYPAITIEEAFKAEIYHEDTYGAAPNQEKAQAALMRDLSAAEQFLRLLTATHD